MDVNALYSFTADAVLVVHVLFVGFVVGGLALIYIGFFLGWRWVRNRWFRVLHLLAIGIVVLQSWLGAICPLTTWEMTLRRKTGDSVYDGSFITHWLQQLLYYEAPAWVFVVGYTGFGGLVLCSWFVVRPSASFSREVRGTTR